MKEETRNAIEVVKQILDDFSVNSDIIPHKINALSHLIQEIESLDKPVRELPSKWVTPISLPEKYNSWGEFGAEKKGRNDLIDQLTPIFNKMKEELTALKDRVDEGKIVIEISKIEFTEFPYSKDKPKTISYKESEQIATALVRYLEEGE